MTTIITPRALARLRKLCPAFLDAQEVSAWGEPTFRIRKKMFALVAAANRHGRGRHAVWIKSTFANQDFLVRSAPERFFIPSYQGACGWIGVYLDGEVNGEQVDALSDVAYRLAPPQPRAPSKR